MKQKLILLLFALQMILPLSIWADGETYYSDFSYSYNGVSYKVSFVDREAYADGLADYRNMTDVKIQGFSLKGSDIYAIMKIATNGRLDMGGEAVDPDKTYSFKATMVRQGFKNSAVTSVQMENTVTTIMPDAFMSCTGLKSIQLSSGISEIPQNCFKGCSKLSAITIPANIKTIGYEAFRACSSLATVSLSYGLLKIDEGAFDSCSGLASIELPNSVSEVGAGAFIDCRSLESVTVSDNLKQIATTTFLGCEKLSAVVFGENSQLEKIGMMAFADCNSLKEFNMPDKLKTLESSNMGSSPFGKSAYDYTGDPIERLKISDAISASSLSTMMSEIKGTLTTVTFGKKPTLKNLDILKGCEKLQSVEIPASITSLSTNTFYYAQNLKEINSNIESPFTITDDVFNSNTYNTATLHVPIGSKSKYQATAGWKNFKEIKETSGGDIIVPDEDGTPEPYAALSDDNKTLTFYYDGKKKSRNGMGVGPFEYIYQKGVNSGWYDLREKIIAVVFDESFADYTNLTSTAWWFTNCKNLETISGLKNLNTDNVTDMSCMFEWCSSLKHLDVSHFNTGNVTNMNEMFYGCSHLTSLDVSNFNTNNVISMWAMFENCLSLTNLDLSSFKTDNVKSMGSMFFHCSSLKSLDVSKFNTENVTSMNSMFEDCSSLTSLNVSHFNTSNVTDMCEMFFNCFSLTSLDISNFNTENVTDMLGMFGYCSSLTSLDISNFNTANVTNMLGMFSDCSSLTSLDVSNFNTTKVENMNTMFYNCSALTTIYCDNAWSCSSSEDMFSGCQLLKGAINFNSNKTDVTYANQTTGYFTSKEIASEVIATIETNKPLIEIARKQGWIASNATLMTKADAEKVTDLGYAFHNNSEIVSLDELVFFTNLTSIPAWAFYGCSGLFSVNIPNHVNSIGDSAFMDCINLVSVNIPKSVTSISGSAFCGCSGLTSVNIPIGVTSIGGTAFCDCSSLTSVVIPNSVTSIGSMAFSRCSSLTSVSIPNNITSIDRYTFFCCSSLTYVSLPSNLTSIGEYAFDGCSGLTSITIPNCVTSIGDRAFSNCSGLSSVTIPSSVTSIGGSAFSDCINLTSVKVEIKDPLTINQWTFTNRANAVLYVPKGSAEAYSKADYWKEFKEIVEIEIVDDTELKDGDTFTAKTIEGVEMTFKVISASDKTCQVGTGQGISIDKEYSGSIIIPETVNGFRVTTVAFEAFGSSKINSVVIGNNVTYIEQNAFISCQWLKSISFPNNNGFSLGFWPFQGCTSLETITLPKNLTSMDSNPFMGCSSLAYIGVDDNNPNYMSVDGVVYSKDSKVICAYPCSRQSAEYEIIDGTQIIGRAAFISASKLEEIHIPNSVSQIYASAFMNCSNLNKLILPPDITYIPQNLALFSGITEVLIPNKVTSIDKYAFYPCNSLNSVIVEVEEPLAIDEYTFGNRANVTLYVPKGCVEAYSKADYWKDFKEIKEIDGGDDDAELKDGDTFTAKTVEGIEMTFKVISATEKTCQVGGTGGLEASIDKEYSGSITIPETINGFRVVTVAFNAFSGSNINSVIIGNNVTYIDQNAFLSCQRLKSVTFPNNNGFRLKHWSFQGCPSLETITLPKNLTSMDGTPFIDCPSLTYIGVEDDNSNYKSIDGVVYSKDSKVIWAYPCGRPSTEYEIIDGTQVIGRAAFMSASKIEEIHIPNSVTRIDDSAFFSCTNLKTLILPPDLTSIPYGLATFSKITEISIPNKVTSIGNNAFHACHSLTSVRVEIEEPLAIDEYTFSNRANATLYVPKGCVDAYSKANYWKDFKEIKEMDGGDADAEFKDGDTFTAKTVEGVEMTFKVISASDKTCQLGDGTKVCIDTSTSGRFTIPAEVNGFRVNSVASWALYGCYGLNEIVISEGVESLMDNSIEQCNGVTSFVLPASVTSLSNTFGGVSSYMKSIKVAEGNPVYDSRNNCNAIIETATNVLRDGCVNTVIPSTVTAIGDWAMSNKNLTSISIPNNVKSIGEGALRYNRFKTVIIPESIEKVSSSAFEECRYLEKVTIASKKCRLEGAAFANCGMLKTVVSYIESPEAVYRNIFNNSYDGATREFILNDNVELYVPFGKKTIYENTNGWKNFKNIVELNATVGDVTGDGEVTKEDITEVETEILEPSEDFDPNKDVNRDGVVNVADIVKSNNIRNSQRQVR